jgi:hypothetical protein
VELRHPAPPAKDFADELVRNLGGA